MRGRGGNEHVGHRIVVVSADIGAGHDAAAGELARRLRARGFTVDRVNFLATLPGPLDRLVRQTYWGMLRWLPWSYQALFTVTRRSPVALALIRAALRPAYRRMLAHLPPDTRAVVTTFPFANQLLGPLREDRRITVPVVAYVTDFAVHPSWISPGVDLYCVVHDAARDTADANGARAVRVVGPLISRRFTDAAGLSRAAARDRFGLPQRARLALIVAGAWGAGDVVRTAREVLATDGVQPVVVCGHNERLRRRLRDFPGHVLGWVADMPALMRAVDVIVENAGGLTCQESLASGLPTVTYRPLPGHGRANAEILTRCGLTTYVDSTARLGPALTDLLTGAGEPAAVPPAGVDVAAVVEGLAPTTPVAAPRPLPRWA
ncbi:MGDG synthase family glycosyltransferase [Micromonospora sp. WMMA1923]|uniref:MGDG synthase family glycosyltransferase n=1 Tax=Micromonospora sp. WMMA1923 TaxID=3404125 RepID=UPI003B94F54B